MKPDLSKTVTETAAAAELASAIAESEKPELFEHSDRLLAFMRTGYELKDFSSLLTVPPRLKQKVTLATPDSFARYVNLFGRQEQTIIAADRKVLAFGAVLDYHEAPDKPSWNEHVALFTLQPTKEWQEWTAQNDKPLDQEAFGTFLEDHIPDISEPAGATLVEMAMNFEAKKDVEFKSSRRMSDGQVEFTYNEEVTGSRTLKVPAEFRLYLEAFEGTDKHFLTAKLRYRIAAGGKLTLWYTLVRPHEVVNEVFEEVLMTVRESTKEHVREIVLGAIDRFGLGTIA